MKHVLAFTGGESLPSARFRVRQYKRRLKELGITVSEKPARPPRGAPAPLMRSDALHCQYLSKNIRRARIILSGANRLHQLQGLRNNDAAWISKGLMAGTSILERLIRKPIFFDVDDAIWLHTKSVDEIAKRAEAVIAGNQYIADHFASCCASVYVVPTAIDTDRFVPAQERARNRESFIVVWTGSSDNLRFLYEVENELSAFLLSKKDALLRIVCDKPPNFEKIPERSVEYVRWTDRNEATALQDADVGFMPLDKTPWANGKCSFKMLQYMAVGIPVVASRVGMNATLYDRGTIGIPIERNGDIPEVFSELYGNDMAKMSMGATGRTLVEREYSVQVVAGKLAKIFKGHLL